MKRVLVVEDNPLNMELVLEILEVHGFKADGAKDGNEAVRMAEKETYDLVIMDIELPGMNGVETTRIIWSKPAYKNVPVVALTAYAMKGDRERYLDSGFDDCVPKPVEVGEFMMFLERYKI